jgi:hypothetical protein
MRCCLRPNHWPKPFTAPDNKGSKKVTVETKPSGLKVFQDETAIAKDVSTKAEKSVIVTKVEYGGIKLA